MSDPAPSESRLSSILDRFGAALSDRESRKKAFGKLLRFIRATLLVLNGGYILWLLVLPLLLRYVGEKNVTFAFLLYVPLQIWLLPLCALSAVTLIFHWRIIPFNLLAAILFVVFAMGYKFGPSKLPSERGDNTFTVMTYNRGQHANQSLRPFKFEVLPDILLMQESSGRATRYLGAEGYTEFVETTDEGEFVLLSKYPIGDTELIHSQLNGKDIPVAARFEVDWKGRKIALYSVHLPSPRAVLRYYMRGAFLCGILGVPGTYFGDVREINQPFWDERIEASRQLAERMANDSLPVIAVGDFNSPQAGYIHGIFDENLDDAHKTEGSGFGFTFPGTTRNPLSLGGPWMRIDHIFYDPQHWKALGSVAEKKRPSQHRAFAAVLEFSE